MDVRTSTARGGCVVTRGGAARSESGYLEVVERRAPRRVPRLQPERERPYDVLRLLGAATSRCSGFDTAGLERGPGLQSRGLYFMHRSRALCEGGRSVCWHECGCRLARETARTGRPR